jgi:hypothetical protein
MALIDSDYFNQQMTTLGLKSAFTPQANQLDTLIAEASEWVEGYCQRKFGTAVTDVVRGKGYRRLILGQYPIQSLTSINYVDDGNNSGTISTSDVRILDGGMLEFKDGSRTWSKNHLYTVAYSLGNTVPGPVKRATALKVVDLLAPMYQGPRDKAVELVSNVQEQIVILLEDYRRERLG